MQDFLNDPTVREIALKVLIAFITALLAAIGYDRDELKKEVDATNEHLRAVRTHNAALLDENLQLQGAVERIKNA